MFGRTKGFFQQNGKRLALGTLAATPFVYWTTLAVAGDVTCASPPAYHWVYEGWNRSFDVAALRRGYQVYKEVCSSCHCVRYICYRHLVGTIFTEKQAKAEAKSVIIEDGPDQNGDLFLRPGNLQDNLPPPYKNDQSARAANNGSLPPDLSLIVGARKGGPNFLFSLLTGYSDETPPGVDLEAGQSYNPFFEDGAISMPPPLSDGAVEYPDSTAATVAQMSKDVTEFFAWSYWRHMDVGKQVGMVSMAYCLTGAGFFFWAKRFMLAHVWAQRLTYKNVKPWKVG